MTESLEMASNDSRQLADLDELSAEHLIASRYRGLPDLDDPDGAFIRPCDNAHCHVRG